VRGRCFLPEAGSCACQSHGLKSPLLSPRDLDLKGIIYEAYEQGRMIAVLPFVNKVRFLTSHLKMQLEHSNSLLHCCSSA
jgi:hypothetical protein